MAAMSQQYSLRWNNHQPNFISMFTTLLNTQTLVDVTLAAEGKHLQAHKVVLSACSTYFQALFIDNPSRHPIVILKDVSFADLRTMVDFMYYGEVNVTEEQLPQVLDTAKLLKIKGLTEMPDSASLTRAPGATDFPTNDERLSTSPAVSPNTKRKRRRKSSSGSQQLNLCEEPRCDEALAVDLVRADAITLSSLPRRRDLFDERHNMEPQQTNEQQNMNVEQMTMDANSAGMPQGPGSSGGVTLASIKQRRIFKRQSNVDDAVDRPRRQASEPVPLPPMPALQKHDSYPQYSHKHRRARVQEQEVGTLLIRTVTVDQQSFNSSSGEQADTSVPTRASHTPAVRSGPPLSCNFCWNTVDECGRILRRKTQYHCPECRTNLCIVPCFHEYHDGPEADASTAK